MSSGAVTEILYHFAGYLHIYNETARARVEYEDFSSKNFKHDLKPTPDGLAGKHHKLDELDSQPVPHISWDPLASPLRDLASDRLQLDRPDPLDNPYDLFQSLIQRLPKFPIQITLSATEPKITVTYQEGGDQLMSLVQQFNRLVDNDTYGIPEGMTVDTLSSREINDAVVEMNETANAEMPDDLVISNFANDALIGFVTERDTASKEAGETTKGQVDTGTYVNGELQAEDAELPKLPESEPVEPVSEIDSEITVNGHPGAAQLIESGSNEVVNIAVIADVNHLSGTMVIVGDHYTTDAIVQVTVLMDEDAVSHAGLGEFTINTHGNEMYNVATFQESDFGVPSFAGSDIFAGLKWSVDVFEGDLYDVHSVTQSSLLKDNDITYQGATESSFQVFAGANGQFNVSTLEALGSSYDLIIVNGNYHHTNLIYQKILLLDPDLVKMLGNGVGPEDDASGSSISTGDNFLMNEALIDNFGTSAVNDLTAELQELIDSLNAQEGVLDVSAGIGLPNFGDGSFDVLVISGSYYDINVINQEIIATDADTLMQYLPAEGDGDEYVPQTTDAGGNVLSNLAAIVTTGPAADYYVGGDQYDDEILIQAEIIVSDDDKIVHEDPDALATELVVFTSSDDNEDDVPETFLPVNDYATSDLLGGTLT